MAEERSLKEEVKEKIVGVNLKFKEALKKAILVDLLLVVYFFVVQLVYLADGQQWACPPFWQAQVNFILNFLKAIGLLP